MTRAEKIAAKTADRRIDEAYRRTCSGVEIKIMDVGKVFAFGRLAVARGDDDAALGAAVAAFVQTIRKN